MSRRQLCLPLAAIPVVASTSAPSIDVCPPGYVLQANAKPAADAPCLKDGDNQTYGCSLNRAEAFDLCDRSPACCGVGASHNTEIKERVVGGCPLVVAHDWYTCRRVSSVCPPGYAPEHGMVLPLVCAGSASRDGLCFLSEAEAFDQCDDSMSCCGVSEQLQGTAQWIVGMCPVQHKSDWRTCRKVDNACPHAYAASYGFTVDWPHCDGSVLASGCVLPMQSAAVLCDKRLLCCGIKQASIAGWSFHTLFEIRACSSHKRLASGIKTLSNDPDTRLPAKFCKKMSGVCPEGYSEHASDDGQDDSTIHVDASTVFEGLEACDNSKTCQGITWRVMAEVHDTAAHDSDASVAERPSQAVARHSAFASGGTGTMVATSAVGYSIKRCKKSSGNCPAGYASVDGVVSAMDWPENWYSGCIGSALGWGTCVLPVKRAFEFCDRNAACCGVSDTSHPDWRFPGMMMAGACPVRVSSESVRHGWRTCKKIVELERFGLISGLDHALSGMCAGKAIRKTIFAQRTRFVYVAGLEHTGHHLWQSIFGYLATNSYLRWAAVGPLIQEVDRRANGHCAAFERPPGRLFERVVDGFARDSNTHRGNATVGIMSCSYPCWDSVHAPHLGFNALAAETAGVDLRIIVTTRAASQIMRVFTKKRAELLLHHCETLLRQIKSLDPRFYACAPYHSYGAALADELAPFLGVDVFAAIEAVYNRSRRGSMVRGGPVVRAAVADLQACIDAIDRVAGC